MKNNFLKSLPFLIWALTPSNNAMAHDNDFNEQMLRQVTRETWNHIDEISDLIKRIEKWEVTNLFFIAKEIEDSLNETKNSLLRIEYTVQPWDTLWSIAERICATDNEDIAGNVERIIKSQDTKLKERLKKTGELRVWDILKDVPRPGCG